MKIVQINSVCGSGSTGKICVAISELLTENGIENYIFHTMDGRGYSLGKQYMSKIQVKIQALKAKVFGNYGFQSRKVTKKLIYELGKINPDIIQLHNLHAHNVNLEMLFGYFKEKNIKIFWTFHDCWAFTAYCMYFDMAQCDKWKSGCNKCPQCKKYSWFFDRSKCLYEKKKELFSGLDLTIITPSQWLADLVKKSFLKNYPINVIHNGIDLEIFKPRESNFRERYSISENKKIILGVANKWEKRKGLDAFIELSHLLNTDKFQFVLVGTNDEIDKRLPENIISIHRTANQIELAEIYTAADVFLNPTREDNFPTVNLESLACGTPVITFDTGGSPECIDETCGITIEKNDISGVADKIVFVCENRIFLPEECISRAKDFDQKNKFKEYIDLYE